MNNRAPFLSRLGTVLYWLGTAIALLLIMLAGINAAAGQYDGSIRVLVFAALVLALGRICKHFLVDRVD